MGRRSINTTKSGKYMNPTDQARKEARKKELKKNKKQRQMVRAAVLKGKDPQQLILDLEKIDQMEYNVLQPSPLNEKVLKDKRKKLRDTLERVLKMYNKDDPDKWAELKRLQVEYERKRSAMFNFYESVKNAQQVQVDEIPLPIAALPAELQAVFVGMPSQIPLPARAPHLAVPPPFFQQPHHSILKKTSAYKFDDRTKEPPGIPPGPPPDLSDDEDERPPGEEDVTMPPPLIKPKTIRFADEKDESREMEVSEANVEEDESREQADKPRPTSLQQKMLAMAGQDIDQFMKEMEEVLKKKKADRAADLHSRLQALEPKMINEGDRETSSPPLTDPSLQTMLSMQVSNNSHPDLPLPPMMFRPPPPRGVPALMGIRLPPGPPPGLPPRMSMRLPPGPPPGMPPRLMRPPAAQMAPPLPTASVVPPVNVLSAAPQLISRPLQEKSGATIQAQAQIRNLSADVTRFLPTALRVKRDSKQNKKDVKGLKYTESNKTEIRSHVPIIVQTKDDAYQQFMKEMEGLL